MAASPQFLKSALRDLLSVSYDMLSTGQGGGASHQRGNAFPRAERGWPVFLARQGGCEGFIIRGRLLSIHRRPPQPSAAEPLSNFRTLGTIAPSNFRTLKPQRGLSIRHSAGKIPRHIPRKKAKHDASPFYFLYFHPFPSILPYCLFSFLISMLPCCFTDMSAY